jgi:hypothetical protein
MTGALADRVIERHGKRLHGRARRITIDLDPTDDPTFPQLTRTIGEIDCHVLHHLYPIRFALTAIEGTREAHRCPLAGGTANWTIGAGRSRTVQNVSYPGCAFVIGRGRRRNVG